MSSGGADSFDVLDAHRFFSANSFNQAWEWIERTNRTPDDDEQMLAAAHASLWHWRHRSDCTPRNLSIGFWQLSRAYALIGHAERANHYGELCWQQSENEPPFYLAYAHEALARSAALAGDREQAALHLAGARKLAEQVAEDADRQALLSDLASVGPL